MKKIQKMLALILALALTFSLAACSQTPAEGDKETAAAQSGGVDTTQTGNEDGKLVVGLIQQDLTNPFHLGEVEGAKACAAKYGFELVVTSGDGKIDKQVEAFDGLLGQCDIISINTLDVTAFENSFKKAAEMGVKVVVQHSWSDQSLGTIGFDEYAMSTEVGEYAVEVLKSQGGELSEKQVVLLTGNDGQGLNENRIGGFVSVMEANNVTILAAEPTNWDGTTAVTKMENYLQAYDKIDMLYGLSDSVTYPAALVIKNADRRDEISICSIDGSADAIQAVIDGDMDSTYLLASQYTGYYKVLIPYLAMTGEYDFTTQGDYILPGFIVTPENASAMLELALAMEKDPTAIDYDKPLEELVSDYLK